LTQQIGMLLRGVLSPPQDQPRSTALVSADVISLEEGGLQSPAGGRLLLRARGEERSTLNESLGGLPVYAEGI
jgi:hypothetical protein